MKLLIQMEYLQCGCLDAYARWYSSHIQVGAVYSQGIWASWAYTVLWTWLTWWSRALFCCTGRRSTKQRKIKEKTFSDSPRWHLIQQIPNSTRKMRKWIMLYFIALFLWRNSVCTVVQRIFENFFEVTQSLVVKLDSKFN